MPPKPPENEHPGRHQTRNQLIEATLSQIEEHGLAKLTVRRVAAAAGANVAAVNYHFRSKQALVDAALEGAIEHMVADSHETIDTMALEPVDGLTRLLVYYAEGARRYPNTSRAHLYDGFAGGDYTGPFPTLFLPVMHRLRDELRLRVPGLSQAGAVERVVTILSAVFFPSFFAGLFAPLGALETPAERAAQARALAEWALRS